MPKSIFLATTCMLLSICASYLMLLGSGFFPKPDWSAITIFSLVILFLSGSKKGFYFLLFPICSLFAFYSPVGMMFGPPSYQYVASVFATDLQESKEFLSQLPLLNLLCPFLIITVLLAIRWLSKKFKLSFYHNKAFMSLALLAIFFVTPPAKFLIEGTNAILQVKAELQRLNSTTSIPSEWGNSTLNEKSRYDDYVLIIGESARRDYHHAYGYPIENTPFMSHSNGTLVDGLTAGGTNTIASLKLMLTKPNTEKWEGNYRLSLMDLIKSANIKSYWISNQGYLGTFDTPVSSLANKSDEKFFLKAGDSFNKNSSDFELLPKFREIITQKADGKRFIVLHLYGSHPLSCDRLTDYPKIFKEGDIEKKYTNLNCYISSIKKTDEMLEKVYQALQRNQKENGRTFSMLYFADHGLSHKLDENNVDMLNLSKSKLHLDVPLFKVSSDDTKRTVYKSQKSGLNFTDGIGNWVGINNANLNPNIDLFDGKNDSNDYGLKAIIDKFETKPDPAIDIRKK